MPRYGKYKWNGYTFHTFSHEFDVFRWFPLAPYFWDSDINLDVVAKPPKGSKRTDIPLIKYKWELHDLDNNLVRSGQDTYEFSRIGANMRKHGGMKIGYLKPQQCYRLTIILTDIYGNTSPAYPVASFTIKDRDEAYTQIFISLVVIIIGIVIGLIVSLKAR